MHAVEVYLYLFIVGSSQFPLTEQALQVSYETVCVCEVRQRAGIEVGEVQDTVMYLSQGVALVKSVISNIPASPPLLAPPSCCSISIVQRRRFFDFKISRLHPIRIIRLTFNPAWKTAASAISDLPP